MGSENLSGTVQKGAATSKEGGKKVKLCSWQGAFKITALCGTFAWYATVYSSLFIIREIMTLREIITLREITTFREIIPMSTSKYKN